MVRRFKERFPCLKDLEFIQYWPGLIDTTRDLFPTVLRDPRERLLGKPLVFSINNAWAKYYQIDRSEQTGASRGAA